MGEHEHRFVAFTSLGQTVRRCAVCLEIEKGSEPEGPASPQPQEVPQEGSGFTTLDEETVQPEADEAPEEETPRRRGRKETDG